TDEYVHRGGVARLSYPHDGWSSIAQLFPWGSHGVSHDFLAIRVSGTVSPVPAYAALPVRGGGIVYRDIQRKRTTNARSSSSPSGSSRPSCEALWPKSQTQTTAPILIPGSLCLAISSGTVGARTGPQYHGVRPG